MSGSITGSIARHAGTFGVATVNTVCPGKKNKDGCQLDGTDKIVRCAKEWLRLAEESSATKKLTDSCDFLKVFVSFMSLGGKLKKFWTVGSNGKTKFAAMETSEKVGHVASTANGVLSGILFAKRIGLGDLGKWVSEKIGTTRFFGIAGKASIKTMKKVFLLTFFLDLAFRIGRGLQYKYGALDWLKEKLPEWAGKGLIDKWHTQELNNGVHSIVDKVVWKTVIWEASEYLVLLGKIAGTIGALVGAGGVALVVIGVVTPTADLVLFFIGEYIQALPPSLSLSSSWSTDSPPLSALDVVAGEGESNPTGFHPGEVVSSHSSPLPQSRRTQDGRRVDRDNDLRRVGK